MGVSGDMTKYPNHNTITADLAVRYSPIYPSRLEAKHLVYLNGNNFVLDYYMQLEDVSNSHRKQIFHLKKGYNLVNA